MKIKLLSVGALLVAVLGLSGCYDVYPGGYGYGGYSPSYGAAEPWYGGSYQPGEWGNWGGWGYPVYYGGHYRHHDWDNNDGWHHGWDHDHFVVPEHGGFVAHNFGAPMGGHGFAVAHNEGLHGGGFHGGSAGGWHAGGGFHGAARGGSHSGNGSHGGGRR